MISRCVERVETVILIFDFRPVCHDETDLAEAANDVLGHLCKRMKFSQGTSPPWQREIGWFLRQRGLQFQFLASFGQR